MNEQHVRVAIPVADIAKRNLGAGDLLTGKVGVINAPGVGTVMVQIDLIWPTVPSVRCCCRGAERDGVG